MNVSSVHQGLRLPAAVNIPTVPTSSRNIPAGCETGSEKRGMSLKSSTTPHWLCRENNRERKRNLFMGYIPFPGRKFAALRGVQQIICLQIGGFLEPKKFLLINRILPLK